MQDPEFSKAGFNSGLAAIEFCASVQAMRFSSSQKTLSGPLGEGFLRLYKGRRDLCVNMIGTFIEKGFAVRSDVHRRALAIAMEYKNAEESVTLDRGARLGEMVRRADQVAQLGINVFIRHVRRALGKDPAEFPGRPSTTENKGYMATITCGLGADDHINILACFTKSRYGTDTELEFRSGDKYGLYKAFNIHELGTEDERGLHIRLSPSFLIRAQNSNSDLTLTVVIKDESDIVKFKRSAGQYGVINVSR